MSVTTITVSSFIAFALPSVPSVSTFRMGSCMTGLTQRNQVVSCVCSSFSQRNLVMNLFNRNDDTFGEALLAEGMCLHIGITDSFPRSAVSTAYSRITAILLVVSVVLFLMLFTEPLFCQLRTAGVMAWVFWFSGQSQHLLQLEPKHVPALLCISDFSVWQGTPPGIRKAPEGLLLLRLSHFTFAS